MKSRLILLLLLLLAFAGCNDIRGNDESNPAHWTLHDIPGITEDEIRAVDQLRSQYDSFTFGILPGTEAFYTGSGEIRGYAVLFTQWLTQLFGIEFITQLHQWGELFPVLSTDFAGELTETNERIDELGFFFSYPIAERSAKYFRINGSQSRSEIIRIRPLRLAFLEGTTTAKEAIEKLEESSVPFDAFFINDYDTAYNMLITGEIDAFIEESVAEAAFDSLGNVVTEDFLPLVYQPVSFSTQNPLFEPIINIVNKALMQGGKDHLRNLYEQGMQEYARHKFFMHLTDEESAFLNRNTAVAYLAEFDNYPLSFFNSNENEWQGIAVDIFKEISALTALTFEPVNKPGVSFSDLLRMLETGEGAMLSELIRNDVREGRFLWPQNHTMLDNYVIISLAAMPNINVHGVMQMSVGTQTHTAYADMFHLYFPNHPNVIEYADTDIALKALERGEVDLLMLSMRHLLAATNYLENPGFKANIVFDNTFASFFGFNINEAILCSIIDKAMAVIDIQTISSQWMQRTFDYRTRIVEAQRPWLIGSLALLSVIIVLTLILYLRNRNIGIRLDKLVRHRTMELHAANNAKSVFLATMSHEIRTPMNAITGMAELALRENLSEAAREHVLTIRQAGANLISIINDILDFSKVEAGLLEIMNEKYTLSSLVIDVVNIVRNRIREKPIRFDTNIDSRIPNNLIGDVVRLRQISLNLLSNAVKYTEEGYISFSISIHPNDEEKERSAIWLKISVSDTGFGIKNEDLLKLFGEFVQLDSAKNRGIEGTGLGLSITKRLCAAMGGDISVESEYGKGSTFSAIIPQGIDLNEPFVAARDAFKKREDNNYIHSSDGMVSFTIPGCRLLIVDDTVTNLKVAEGLLSSYEAKIDTCVSGVRAIQLIEQEDYDIVFMDHMMPELDGIETTTTIRALGVQVPIIALTANAVSGMREIFLERGFNDFLPKPIEVSKLDEVLKRWIPEEKKEYGRVITKNNVKVVNKDLLMVFASDAEKAITALQTTLDCNDLKLYTTTAHAMKSALANIGENELSLKVQALEEAGIKGDKSFLSENTESFIKSLIALLENINLNRADRDEDPNIVDDKTFLLEELQIIKSACEDYNDKAAYEAFDRLNEKKWRANTQTSITELRNTLFLHSDFDKVIEQAGVLMENCRKGSEL
ncbi:MAG: ATP-binding protein [Treponema sp.]|nr:ATP-binding protein [Treponema sp.]